MQPRFTDELQPLGPVEEMLVDQIVTAHWRLRRTLTAEAGEIALGMDGGQWKREKHNPLSQLLAMPPNPFSESLVVQLEYSAWGCRYLIHCLSGVRQAVERDGELTETELADFNRALRDQGYGVSNQLQKFRIWLVSNPEKMEPAPLWARHKEEVLKYLDRKIRALERLLDQRERRENAEADAKQAAATLPSVETLEKIQRYETALERRQYRAMAQLERLQRMRRGEVVPAPISMVV